MSDSENTPRNRRERRAAAKADGKPAKQASTHNNVPRQKIRTLADIPLAQPDRSGPKSKTLYEIAEERSNILKHGQPFAPSHSDGKVRDEGGNMLSSSEDSGDIVGPFGEALFLTTSLAMVHFTLDVLVYHQYKQEIEWQPIFKRTGSIFPVLLTLIYLLHSKTAMAFNHLRQCFYLGIAVAAGCYMIHVGNQGGYFAVMKQAPPLGTLWILSVIEMKLPFALASMLINSGYLIWKGYTIF